MTGTFSYIKFTNIGPFRNFETKCGQAMLVTADNGEGKSTFLSAIRALLDDHNADLITIGEEEAEAYFEFTNGMTVRQTITKRGSKYDIRLPDGQKVLKRHKEFLQSLVTGIALDPMKLITCSKDERVDYLLSVLPITFQPEAIHEACGVAPPDTLTLEQFDNLVAAKESDRTEQNKRVDASKGLLSRLERSLPKYEADGKDWTAEASQLQSQRDKVDSDLQAFIKERRQSLAAEVKAVATEAEGAIEAARLEFERKKQEILRRSSEEQGRLEREASVAIEFEQLRVAPELDAVNEQLHTARERAKNQSEVEALRHSVEETRSQLREESQEATRRQRIVDAMRDLRRKQLDSLPIPGIEIRNRELYVDGKLFSSQANSAEQIKVAFQVAALGANQNFPIMIADGGDLLNETNLRWIADAAVDGGFQVFISKRVEGQKGVRVVPYSQYQQEQKEVA